MSKPKYEIIVEGVDYLWELYEMEEKPTGGLENADEWEFFAGAEHFYGFIRERCGYPRHLEEGNK